MTPVATSASECEASAAIAAEPVRTVAPALANPIPRSATRATQTVRVLSFGIARALRTRRVLHRCGDVCFPWSRPMTKCTGPLRKRDLHSHMPFALRVTGEPGSTDLRAGAIDPCRFRRHRQSYVPNKPSVASRSSGCRGRNQNATSLLPGRNTLNQTQ
jgi:hypothetical protein